MKKKSLLGQTLLMLAFTVLCVLFIMPFVLLVSVSFSKEADIAMNGYKFWPENFDLSAYSYIFKNPTTILNAYKVTAFYSIAATVLSLFLQSLMAYPLSWGRMRGRNFISFFLYFTMLFSGGMVPTYILLTQYMHLDNTIWIYIIPGLISPWNIFMIRTFFNSLPYEIYESSVIDGASEFRIYLQMAMPLSKPVLATLALMTFLGKWNDWNTSLMYIDNSELFSLQYLLQKILKDITLLQQMEESGLGMINAAQIPSETVRMAMAIVVAGPALVIFPFFQKYFVKGMTVGSVKG
ncbi:MAG: carbohydrate ABC transporter permease [Clostridia bacterium]|nr:carbohydrate ABC transporter permease [Clostridia bacterium]